MSDGRPSIGAQRFTFDDRDQTPVFLRRPLRLVDARIAQLLPGILADVGRPLLRQMIVGNVIPVETVLKKPLDIVSHR